MQNGLEELLDESKGARPARLIPTVSQTRKEERLVSVLLGTLRIVPPLAEALLDHFGVKLGKTGDLTSYVEVRLPEAEDGTGNRPDGLICVSKRNGRWPRLSKQRSTMPRSKRTRFTDTPKRPTAWASMR